MVEQLKLVLLDSSQSKQALNSDAYTLFLQGRSIGRLGSKQAIRDSISKFEQALAIEPHYSQAWSELALSQIRLEQISDISQDEAFGLARVSLEKAIAADPANANAHSRLAWLAMSVGDLQESASHHTRALNLAPENFGVVVNAAQLLTQLHRHEEALGLYRRALELDPVSPAAHWNYADGLFFAERLTEAEKQAREANRLGPNFLGVDHTLGNVLLLKGDFEAALSSYQDEEQVVLRASGVAMALHSLGRTSEFDLALESLIEQWGDERPSEIAAVYIWTGDLDAASTWLERAIRENDRRVYVLMTNPLMRSVSSDPRWVGLLERTGRAPDQLSSIRLSAG